MKATPVRSRTVRTRWPLGLALAALLLGQWLALLHGVGHGRPVRVLPGAASTQEPPSLFKALGGHEAAGDTSVFCQLFDQLAQPAPLGAVPVAALAEAPPAQPALRTAQRHPTGFTPVFLARAPPRAA